MANSIFWYDFETTGINPRRDRALQVAGIRTTEDLQEVDEPLNINCRLSDDILPHPLACLITGIDTGRMLEGLPEVEFVRRLEAELARPGTCTAGYNSIRFDDELTRYTLYRNFYDPYAREWQGGNSRWDILDSLRCAWALRPEGINWPLNEQGLHSFRLEDLTRANGIEHGQAHDALADVRATIAVARLLKENQPRLYDYLYRLRKKDQVLQNIHLGKPLVHISGRISTQRYCLAVVLPLMCHPHNSNAFVVCDLQADISPLLQLDAGQIKQRLYTSQNELAPGELPVPLKLVHVNRCPVVLPMSVLRATDMERLGLDAQVWTAAGAQLLEQWQELQEKLVQVYAKDDFEPSADPEQQLYQGFLQNRDRNLVQKVRQADAQELSAQSWPFDDERLPELLFRYRARNYPQSLDAEEQKQWHAFCRERLLDEKAGAPLTLSGYMQAYGQLSEEQKNTPLMQDWLAYVQDLQRKYAL